MIAGPVGDAGFVASKLVEAVLRPSTLLLAGSIVGAACLMLRLPRRAARFGTALLAASLGTELLLALVPFDDWVLAPLENAYPRLAEPVPAASGVIVLGGAVDPVIAEARGTDALNAAAERMTEFVRLARVAPPGEALAFTGGSGRVVNGRLTEADVARHLFASLGVAEGRVVYEGESRTTWENARELARLLHPDRGPAGAPWILVTSASHMPRAVAAFRDHGFTVVADPVDYRTGASVLAQTDPTYAGRLARLDLAAHEWEGLAVYRLLGRTRVWLPREAAGQASGR